MVLDLEWSEARPRRRRGGSRGGGGCAMVVDCSQRGTAGDELKCMTCNAYREAGNDPSIVEVNRTGIARVESGRFARSICGVIYQRSQFSWTVSPRTCTTPAAWARSAAAAKKAKELGSNGYINFYATYIYPSWARNCYPRKRVGTHWFCSVGGSRLARRRDSPAVSR